MIRPENKKRYAKIAALLSDGQTLQEVATQFGITRERVRQISRKFGLDGANSGMTIRIFKKTQDKQDALKAAKSSREARCFARYGCSLEYLKNVSPLKRTDPKSPVLRFRYFERNCKMHKVECLLSFREWWETWLISGKWEQCGRGHNYCMARIGNSGAFEIGNVEIKSGAENSKDSYLHVSMAERLKKRSIRRNK